MAKKGKRKTLDTTGLRKATRDDLQDGTIRPGISYFVNTDPYEFTIEKRRKGQSPEEYEKYKADIRTYVKEDRLWIKVKK
jgi:hypothetical protein